MKLYYYYLDNPFHGLRSVYSHVLNVHVRNVVLVESLVYGNKFLIGSRKFINNLLCHKLCTVLTPSKEHSSNEQNASKGPFFEPKYIFDVHLSKEQNTVLNSDMLQFFRWC